MDTNGDRFLSNEEINAFMAIPGNEGPDGRNSMAPKIYKRLDRNGDGKVDWFEFSGKENAGPLITNPEKDFENMDGNGDGKLTEKELNDYMGVPEGDPTGGIPEEEFNAIDKNQDGSIDLTEFMAMTSNSSQDASAPGTSDAESSSKPVKTEL